jgi:hypothetical protein
MFRLLLIVFAAVFSVSFASAQQIFAYEVEYGRCVPANATTLRQYYKAINAVSAAPAINGTLALLS